MKILRFNEVFNPDNKPKLIKEALFVSGDGSGSYQLCGSLDPDTSTDLENAKKLGDIRFKRFSFVLAKSLKEVDPYEDSDSIVWKNYWGHLMINKSSYVYEGVHTNKFPDYYDLLEKYSDYKYEMLPYFIADSYGTSVSYVKDFFERLIENSPYGSGANCWKDTNIVDVLKYIKDCGVHKAYEKTKEYILADFKFAKYWLQVGDPDITPQSLNISDKLDEIGF